MKSFFATLAVFISLMSPADITRGQDARRDEQLADRVDSVRSTRSGTRARTSPLETFATVTSVRGYLSGRRLRVGISTRLAYSHVGAGGYD